MRILKIVAGLLVALGALFVIVGEQLAGASADAVVNARLSMVRAPIAGVLRLDRRDLGTLVEQGETLGTLADPLVDDIRLNDLLLERAVAEAEARRLENEIDSLEMALRELGDRSEKYSVERVRQLEARLEERRARARAIEARLEEARSSLTRSSELQTRGMETAAAFDRARAASRVAERELEAARSEISVAEIDLAAARSGIFLGEGYNDAPYSEQRISELGVESRRLASHFAQERDRSAALEERIAAERRRVNRLSSSEIKANVRGRLWTVLSADGERLQRGQDVLRLVDCDSTMVTLSVAESVYNRLKVGDSASFRMDGDSRVFQGTVLRLAGSGAATIYQNLAVAPSEKHLERYDVALKLPGLSEDTELGCAVGRTGRAFFESRPLDAVRRFWE